MTSRTAEIRAVAQSDLPRAEAMLAALIADLFAIPVRDLKVNVDQYSLNSLNGFFGSGDREFFFKFHQEEGEEAMRGEYYRAGILAEAGLPVDQPVHMSTLPGEQLLVYRRRPDPRFSDVLWQLDQTDDPAAIARAEAAERVLNARILACAEATLKPITPSQSQAEPLHRLFHERLVEPPARSFPGGRLARFYVGKDFLFPGDLRLTWDEIKDAVPVVNGVEHALSLGAAFDLAHRRYAPEALADAGGIVAHGDAHNANVWYERGDKEDVLSFFDPAFAGDAVPSLVAEVKPTFHNIFAHPFWLYDPDMAADRFRAEVRLQDGRLHIDTDWQPTPVRRALLRAKAETFWKPWLATLKGKGLLPPDWEQVIRLGIFLSPTLVMNLNAASGGRHNPTSSAIGLSVALAAASAPVAGRDMFSEFCDLIRPQA